MNTRRVANGLGWFSLALGVTELVAAEPLARALGMKSPGLLRAYGVREIVAGIGVLNGEKKGPWIWARIAGDALDVVTLASALGASNPKRGNVALAMAVVSPVVILDVLCGEQLGLDA
ncbi:MAG: cyclase dehydrase [Labilithrix sp.]|nr:cyclase dehydrase [Labilithrix sp.]